MNDLRLQIAHGAPAGPARHAVERALQAWKLADLTTDALIVTNELVQNVTHHTTNGGELHLRVMRDVLLIEVTDINPIHPQVRRPEQHTAGGRGLPLVVALTRAWGSRHTRWTGHSGKTVWAELSLHPA
jgi:anti-sigma regulatory factor (Ser/Thr protein kinase)